MKTCIYIHVVLFYGIIHLNTYSQDVFPYSSCDVDNILMVQNNIRKQKLRSRITWLQDNIGGNHFQTGKKIKQENYNRDGSLAEIIYFNQNEKTDSITIIANNASGLPYKTETFDPLGNLLSTVRFTYSQANLILDVRYYRKSKMPYSVIKTGYKDDTIRIWELDHGTKIISKTIIVYNSNNSCNNIFYTTKTYNEKDSLVFNSSISIINNKKITNVYLPVKHQIIQTNNSFSQPVEITKMDENNQVETSIVYNYSENGLINGFVTYNGLMQSESGNENYDILSNEKPEKKSGLMKIIKYSYLFY